MLADHLVLTAALAAVTRGARDGILIRGGAFLDGLAAVRTVAFDKTGTLTEGRPRLTDVVALNGARERDVLTLAASIEAASEHPLAGAVVSGAHDRGVNWQAATDVRAEPGIGVHARIGSERLFVGRPDAADAADGPLRELAAAGKTVMVARATTSRSGCWPLPTRSAVPAAVSSRTCTALASSEW